MNKLPVYVSENDLTDYVLPHLSHKPGHNRLKASYHYIFNTIPCVLKSGCPWRTLTPEGRLATWQNIHYHYDRWCSDGSSGKFLAGTHQVMKEELALEGIQSDGSHTPSEKGAEKSNIKGGRVVIRQTT